MIQREVRSQDKLLKEFLFNYDLAFSSTAFIGLLL